MKPTVNDQLLALRSYLYDHLIGRNRNQSYMHGQAFWSLPRDVVKSVALLATAVPKADKKELSTLIAKVEANIMLAQTTQLLTPQVTEQALVILDHISDELIKGK